MVPALWVELDQIPLTANGKIDRKALPDPELADMAAEYVAPRNETEQALAEIWQDLLAVDRIGIYDNFFELGGHSLLAMRVVSAIRTELNVELSIKDLFNYPKIVGLAAYLDKQNKGSSLPTIVPVDRPEYIPLSFSQERLWFIDRLEGSIQYHIPAVLRLHGELNIDALEETLKTIVNRHEVLRTAILEHDGSGYQQIMPADNWKLGITEESSESEAELSAHIARLISKPFDLSHDYMFRADLIKPGKDDHILAIVMHHIAADGWSISIMVKEVVELYERYTAGGEVKLPLLPVQYADYAIWQRKYLQGELLENKLSYWKAKLNGVATLQLPSDYSRPPVPGSRGAKRIFKIEQELSARLITLGHQQGTTLYMTLLAALNVLLYRYSGQDDICVGTPVAGRSRQELEGLIGFFVNTLAMRSRLRADMSFIELLQDVKVTTLEAYSNEEVPFERVVDAVVKVRDMSRNPLFQVLFILQNTPNAPQVKLGELSLSTANKQHTTSQFDITFVVNETSSGIQLSVEYSTDLYGEGTIDRMASHYINLLSSIVTSPAVSVSHLDMLTESEEQTLLESFNETAAEFPKNKSIIDLFEIQAEERPEAIAVVFEDERLTYKELNRRSNQVAHYLQSKGVKTETLVPVCVERGLEMLIGILGIMKAGGTYVPIDPDYPADRISYMLEDSGAELALTSKGSREKLGAAGIQTIMLDEDWAEIEKEKDSNPATRVSADQLAYVIYTSGSTGKPKGVMIEHRSVVNLLVSIAKEVNFTASSKFLSVTTYSFDICYLELFVPLISGAELVIVPRETASDGFRLVESLAAQRPTHMQATPSTWQMLADGDWRNGEHVKMLIGGEAVKEGIKDYLTGIGEVWNVYGPTETTIWSAIKKLAGDEKVTIGKPLSNTQIYIISGENELNPVGVSGEICIGGAGLARGYWRRPELTAEKFINDPFTEESGARLYRTGDLGRWLPDGNIECLGRMDDQVKIRGYRIELGEIDSVLNQVEQVKLGVVVAKADSNGNKRLVGYVVAKETFDKQVIQSYLAAKLPDYMVPALWVELDQIPLTANGKIDRKALPDPELADMAAEYVAPRNATEQALASIWQDLLAADRIGIYDNFFELGGHSLLAMRVVSAIRSQMGMEIAVKDLFVYPTIASLSVYLNLHGTDSTLPAIVAITPRPEHIPLSFSQERLWFIDNLEKSAQYHMPAVIRLKGALNTEALENALRFLVDRHEVLRTIITAHEGQGYQQIMASDGWKLEVTEEAADWDGTRELSRHIAGLVAKPFDLSNDYMFRGDLIKLGKDDHILAIVMHHIASDGWSISIMVKEVVELYEGYTAGGEVKLPLLPVQYVDYAIWQRNWLQGSALEEKLQYWKGKLQGTSPLELPTDYLRGASLGTNGSSIGISIGKGLSVALQTLSRSHGATMYMTLLSAFNVLLYRYSGQEDICVGAPIAGRDQQEIEGLIGFFVNTLAIRTQVSGDMMFSELLEEVKGTTMEAYAHQEVPFEKVVEVVVKERDMSRSPLFQVMFTLQNTPDVLELKFSGLDLSAERLENATTLFELTFAMVETNSGIQGTVQYNTDLYKAATIERMIGHYNNLLESIVATPRETISNLAMMGAAEERQLLEEFNDTATDYPKEKNIVNLFEEQVTKNPEATAVVFEGEQLTYSELDSRSNQLARYLQKRGVKAEVLVPVCVERGLEMIVGILGILKAGGAYVPVDPDYPADRISYMLEDTEASIILSSNASRQKLPGSSAELIAIDGDWQQIAKEESSSLRAAIRPEQLAYVIFTSGSTGRPKGVMIEHQSLTNYSLTFKSHYSINDKDRILQQSSISFDTMVEELYPALISGANIFIVKEGGKDIYAIKDYIENENISILSTTPSVIEWLNKELVSVNALRYIISGGEVLPPHFINNLYPAVQVVNTYGPSETTVCATYNNVDDIKYASLIGKPISNTRIYIVTAEKTLSPVGVIGEICIGGVQVARGYLNKPELTAEKFISDPFGKEEGSQLYRTGDIGRWLPDGNIEYLGRMDDQVKIRGYRIELGEIESVLNQSGQVRQAVVVVREDKQGTKRLVGYVIPTETFDKQAIQNYLRSKLPEFMVPALWVELENMPLTASGKINTRALANPEVGAITSEYVGPRNETERALVEIWQQLLGVEQAGIYDNFFELGGHSLLAMRMISHIRKSLGVGLPISDIFVYPNVAALATRLESEHNTATPLLISMKTGGNKIPLYMVCGSGGTVLKFANFVKMLDDDQPVYGIQQPADSNDLKEIPNTTEGIAEMYVKAILKQNPNGPYALAGHCFGGIIAIEMAKQLKALDKKVALVALFDVYAKYVDDVASARIDNYYNIPNVTKKSFAKILQKARFEMYLLLKHPQQSLQYKLKKLQSLLGRGETNLGEIEVEFNKVTDIFQMAFSNYQMKRYYGDLVVFYAKENYYFSDWNRGIFYKKISVSDENKYAWKKYVRSVKTYEIDGEHSTIFDPKNAVEFSRILQQHLEHGFNLPA
jgi:amino acid adenylation domain-containing protein